MRDHTEVCPMVRRPYTNCSTSSYHFDFEETAIVPARVENIAGRGRTNKDTLLHRFASAFDSRGRSRPKSRRSVGCSRTRSSVLARNRRMHVALVRRDAKPASVMSAFAMHPLQHLPRQPFGSAVDRPVHSGADFQNLEVPPSHRGDDFR